MVPTESNKCYFSLTWGNAKKLLYEYSFILKNILQCPLSLTHFLTNPLLNMFRSDSYETHL